VLGGRELVFRLRVEVADIVPATDLARKEVPHGLGAMREDNAIEGPISRSTRKTTIPRERRADESAPRIPPRHHHEIPDYPVNGGNAGVARGKIRQCAATAPARREPQKPPICKNFEVVPRGGIEPPTP
jgi:hypothetical protein